MFRVEYDLTTNTETVLPLTPEEIAALPPPPANAQKLSAELAALSSAYQLDLEQYRLLWTSISIAAGVNEETRKANLRTQWNARTTQYSADVAATKLKYQ